MSTVRPTHLVAVIFALAIIAAIVPSVDATPRNPNSCVGAVTATCPGTLDVFNADPVSFLISNPQMVTPLSGTYSGTLLSAVYQNTSRGNQLDFYYQFTNNATCPNPAGCDAVTRLTAFNFTGVTTDVGYRTDFNVNGF